MAAGDILSVVIPSNGWTAEITIEGKGTGGTYDFGIANEATDPDPTNAKIKFTVISKSKSATDESDTTILRTVWATKFKKVPATTNPDESVSGSDVIVRVHLNEPIYAKDKTGAGNSGTNPAVTILSGFYTQAGGNNAVTDLEVTNNSTEAYPLPDAKFGSAPYRMFGSGENVEVVVYAFGNHAQQGKPVKFVKFTVTDEGAHTTTEFVSGPVAITGPYATKVGYRCSISQSAFTQGDKLTVNARAYDWVGDTPIDSGDGTFAVLSPNFCPQEYLCNKSGTYGVTMAKIDATSGNDSTGVAYDSSSYDYATAAAFLTAAKAFRAIRDYNNTNRSRDDVGGGIVEAVAGNYAWMGSTQAGGYGTTPKTWVTLRAGPGVARSDVVINSTSGDRDVSDRIKLQGLTITTNTANTFDSTIAMWCYDVHFNCTTNIGLFNTTNGRVWFENCKVEKIGTQGVRFVSGTNWSPVLVSDCDFSGFDRTIHVYCVVGNKKTGITTPASILLITETTGMAPPKPVRPIIAFNQFYGYRTDFNILTCGEVNPQDGMSIIQNIFESAQNGGAQELAAIGSSDSFLTNTPLRNFKLWHNVWVGQRCTVGYNDDTAGDELKERLFWPHVGNYWARWANKGDLHGTPHANRIGAWTIEHQVLANGDVKGQVMFSLPSNFFARYPGDFGHQPTTSEAVGYPLFVDDNSFDGTSNGTGDGNYRTQAGSPLRNKVKRLVLPVDLEGSVRSTGFNDAGAYTVAEISSISGGGGGISMGLGLGIP